MYRRLESPFLLSLQLARILLAAALWGLWGGLVAGVLSTAAVGVPVAVVKPAVLLQVLALCAFFYAGIGGPWAWVSVSDTGCGMDQAALERAFEPYFATRGFGAGAGGLTKVHGIVSQNHGVIGLTSRPGQGTTVNVCLPSVSSQGCASPGAEPL